MSARKLTYHDNLKWNELRIPDIASDNDVRKNFSFKTSLAVQPFFPVMNKSWIKIKILTHIFHLVKTKKIVQKADKCCIVKQRKIVVLRKSHFFPNFQSFSLLFASLSQIFPFITHSFQVFPMLPHYISPLCIASPSKNLEWMGEKWKN